MIIPEQVILYRVRLLVGSFYGYLTAFNQVSTSLAASYILPHGNRIGLSYRWHYLTSRTSALAPYRFEQANHAILLTLDLLLN